MDIAECVGLEAERAKDVVGLEAWDFENWHAEGAYHVFNHWDLGIEFIRSGGAGGFVFGVLFVAKGGAGKVEADCYVIWFLVIEEVE